MQEKTKNKLLIAIAIITTVLIVFNLGLMFGQAVYADDWSDVPSSVKLPSDLPYTNYQGYQNLIKDSSFNKDDDFIYFTTEYYYKSGSSYRCALGIFYFVVEGLTLTEDDTNYIFETTSTNGISYYHNQLFGEGCNFPNSISVDKLLYCHKIVIDKTLENCYIYEFDGTVEPLYIRYITDSSGKVIGLSNFFSNLLEADESIYNVNVQTTITPTFSGVVGLNHYINGTSYKSTSFKIRFENHSNFPVQVRWYARRTGLGRLSTDNLFQYGNLNIKNDCAAMIFQHGNVYTKNMNSQTWFDANLTMSQMKNSEWFSLGTNEYNNYKEIEISYTSTSFQPNVSYTWYTEALKTGSYGSVCEVFYSGSTGENPYPTNHAVDIDGLTLCQSDTFQFTKEYTFTYESSGVGSDASCVGSDEDYLINSYSSSGRSDTVGSEGGDTSYKNLYLDKTSWLHEYSNDKWTNSGGSQYTDVLLRDANGFTAFMKSAFNIFPPEVNAVIVFTFIAVGFIIILKFVRG